VIEAVLREQGPMMERAQRYIDKPSLVTDILEDGREKAAVQAEETMRDVREAMGLGRAR
jgi:tryptophanyl-tRNA synthetase